MKISSAAVAQVPPRPAKEHRRSPSAAKRARVDAPPCRPSCSACTAGRPRRRRTSSSASCRTGRPSRRASPSSCRPARRRRLHRRRRRPRRTRRRRRATTLARAASTSRRTRASRRSCPGRSRARRRSSRRRCCRSGCGPGRRGSGRSGGLRQGPGPTLRYLGRCSRRTWAGRRSEAEAEEPTWLGRGGRGAGDERSGWAGRGTAGGAPCREWARSAVLRWSSRCASRAGAEGRGGRGGGGREGDERRLSGVRCLKNARCCRGSGLLRLHRRVRECARRAAGRRRVRLARRRSPTPTRGIQKVNHLQG